MSFAATLETATALATEYTKLCSWVSSMATAADHDPRWCDADEAELNKTYARRDEVTKLIAAAIAGMARDHRDDWQRFLLDATEQLDLAGKHVKKTYVVGGYEHDQFRRWIAGALPVDDQAVIFARAVAVLAEHRDVIERVSRKPS